jgi:dihydroorotate dehydrogenase (fumarate)
MGRISITPALLSLKGASEAGWVEYARLMQQAGAHAIELNIYFVPTDAALTSQGVDDRYVDILGTTRRAVSVPLAVKLSTHVSALGNLAQRLRANEADGLVLSNRLLQPDIDLATMRFTQSAHLSTRVEMSLPLLWVALLAGRTRMSLAASTGVEDADDVVMTTSALLRNGPVGSRRS